MCSLISFLYIKSGATKTEHTQLAFPPKLFDQIPMVYKYYQVVCFRNFVRVEILSVVQEKSRVVTEDTLMIVDLLFCQLKFCY